MKPLAWDVLMHMHEILTKQAPTLKIISPVVKNSTLNIKSDFPPLHHLPLSEILKALVLFELEKRRSPLVLVQSAVQKILHTQDDRAAHKGSVETSRGCQQRWKKMFIPFP